jgi:hypothetical protein
MDCCVREAGVGVNTWFSAEMRAALRITAGGSPLAQKEDAVQVYL